MRHTSIDNLRVSYLEELNLQFDLRAKIREAQETGVTVGTDKLGKLLDSSMSRCRQ